jgi:hypothetical protein
MESAYLFMLASFAASFVLGMLTLNNWVAVGLPAMTPTAVTISKLGLASNPGFGETLLFLSPFLVGGTVLYAFICFGAVRVGRGLRARLARSKS